VIFACAMRSSIRLVRSRSCRPGDAVCLVYGVPSCTGRPCLSQLVTGAGAWRRRQFWALSARRAGLLSPNLPLVIEAKVGSSALEHPEPGVAPSGAPGRGAALLSRRAPHTAEVLQELSGATPLTVHFSATAIEMVPRCAHDGARLLEPL